MVTKSTARWRKVHTNGKSWKMCLKAEGKRENPEVPRFIDVQRCLSSFSLQISSNHWHMARRPASFAAAGAIDQSRGFVQSFLWWQLWGTWTKGGRDQLYNVTIISRISMPLSSILCFFRMVMYGYVILCYVCYYVSTFFVAACNYIAGCFDND